MVQLHILNPSLEDNAANKFDPTTLATTFLVNICIAMTFIAFQKANIQNNHETWKEILPNKDIHSKSIYINKQKYQCTFGETLKNKTSLNFLTLIYI